MKKITLVLLFISASSLLAQSREDFAKVFLKRAKNAVQEDIDFASARISFEKALEYIDAITDKEVALLGRSIYLDQYELQPTEELKLDFLQKSLKYSKQYFLLENNKRSDAFSDNLSTQITITDLIKEVKQKLALKEQERLRKEREVRKIDSLKAVWSIQAEKLSVIADTIYNFNKNKFALFNHKGKFGIVNDKAITVVKATEFSFGASFEGYILLQDKQKNPTKIYYFNTNNGSGNLLPPPSDISPLATHYGQVMLPRGNGRLVTYPNNCFEPLVFDLNQNKVVRVANVEEVLKALKKNDIIKKYNKDGELKLDKEKYNFGGHLGGGVHPLYQESSYNVFAYLCSVDGTVLYVDSDLEYLGAFYENKLQGIKEGEVSWINQNGTEVSEPKDKSAIYDGESKIVKIEDGIYRIFSQDKIIKGDETLEKLPAFLRKFKK